MTGANPLIRGRHVVTHLIKKLNDNLLPHRRRRLAAPVLCESLEQRTLMSTVVPNYGGMTTPLQDSTGVRCAVTADFNGDNILDIAAILGNGKLRVSLGSTSNGQTVYQDADKTDYNLATSNSNFLTVLDYNNDGINDLAYAFTNIDGKAYIGHMLGVAVNATNIGDGTFGAAVNTAQGDAAFIRGLFVSDLNQDTIDDLVLVYSNGISNYAGFNAGAAIPAQITHQSELHSGAMSCVTMADLNGDNIADLAYVIEDTTIAMATGHQVNGAEYEFVTVNATLTTASPVLDLAIADMNHAIYPQIVALLENGVVVQADLTSNGTPLAYKAPATIATVNTDAEYLIVADVNGDNFQDLVGISADGDYKAILASGFTFSSSATTNPSGNLFGANSTSTMNNVQLLDLNGDGRLDFFVTGSDGTNGFVGQVLDNGFATTSHTIDSTHRSFSYVDDTGDTVTITLSGPGSAVVTVIDTSKLVDAITLSGTTLKSTLKITVANKLKTSPKTTTIGRVILNNCTLGSLDAASVDFSTALNADGIGGIVESGGAGFVKTIKVRDLGDDTKITLTGSDAKNLVTITARVVGSDCDLYLTNQSLNSATFVSFGDRSIFEAVTLGKLSVTGDKKLSIAGDFRGALDLAGINGSKGYALKTAVIAGALAFDGGVTASLKANLNAMRMGLYVGGKAGSITIGSVGEEVIISVDTSLSTLTIKGDFLGELHAGSISTMTIYGSTGLNVGAKAEGLGNVSGDPFTGIRVDTTLSSLTIKGNFQRGLRAGSVGTMTVNGNTLGSKITINGITGKNAIGSLKIVGTAKDLTLDATGNIKSFSAKSLDAQCDISATGNIGSFTTSSDFNGILTAASIGSMTVKGNITTADLTLNAVGATKPVLGKLNITGNVADLDIISSAAIGTVTAKSFGADSSFSVTGNITKLQSKADFDADITASGKLTNLTVGGNLADSTITLGANTFAANTSMLGLLSVTGKIEDSIISGYGSIGTLSAKALVGVHILAGSVSTDTIDTSDDFTSAQSIDKLTISGDKTLTKSITGSVIGAYNIKTIALAYPDTSSVVANTIAKMSVTNMGDKKAVTVTDTKLVAPGTDPHANDGITVTLFPIGN